MLATPLPDAEEIRDNATFDAVLGALSRPGTLRDLPEPGPLCIALALLDRECRVHAGDETLSARIAATGAALVPAHEADHVFMAADSAEALAVIAGLDTGSHLYPDEGATLIVPARIGAGQALQLTGPGIKSVERICLDGIHPGFWALRARLCAYPRGIEVLIHDGARLLALPRSTQVTEV
ncbi:MAG: phosphonate C-P lyase system protein PhnH [Rhodobacteraceae bacterium]|nr:phosphonate C-P lyase system protein PhnH [Paracoccaceae bacterium]MBR9821147.1 phosphonate C-P lyase system protein PhnH [Paracoccaceae bacterium]